MKENKANSKTQVKKNIKPVIKKDKSVGNDLGKLKLLCLIVDKKASERFIYLLTENEINVIFSTAGKGTSKGDFYSAIDVDGGNKTVIFCFIRENREKEILGILNEKFEMLKSTRNGIAFTVDFSSVIGVSTYQFLANQQK